MARAVQLRRGSETLDLTASPYSLQAGGWTSEPGRVEARLLALATTEAELDRYLSTLRRWISQAETYQESLAGDPVHVYSKTCDALTQTAELGATWRRAMVAGGQVVVESLGTNATPQWYAFVRVGLDLTESTWRRAAAASVLEASSSSTTVGTDGSLTVPASATLTARRRTYLAGGFTVRARWAYSDNDCVFCNAEAGANDVKAYYQASDNKVYMQDSAGTTASSSALSIVAGTETDLVFRWSPGVGMAIWVNGTANGTAASCVLDFGSYGSELLTNGGFETVTGTDDDGTSDTFAGWTAYLVDDGVGNKIESTATVSAGSHAVKMTKTTQRPLLAQSVSVTPGARYKLSFYARGDGTNQGSYAVLYGPGSSTTLISGSTGVTAAAYAAVNKYFSAPAATTSVTLAIYAPDSAGTCYFDAVSAKQIVEPSTYQVFAPSTASQTLYGWQLWAAALTDAECAGFSALGRPEAGLMYYLAPTDDKGTNAHYKLYNAGGDAPGLLRLMLASGSADQDQIRAGLRPLAIQTTHKWECESGTLGTDVAANSNSDASGGSQARFTPAATTTVTRVTVVICADPDDVKAMAGEYRVLIAGYDSAASVGINLLKWRLVTAGQAEDYSDEYAFTAVATRSLMDVGTVSIPPGAWPEESLAAVTDVQAGSYITLEIASRNTVGSGGGTLDLDAVYLFPAEREGVWTGDYDVSAVKAVIDHASDPPAAVTIYDEQSLEFAGWGQWVGDMLALTPAAGACGSLCLIWYRNAAEQVFPNDTSDVLLFYLPRWR